MQEEACNIVWDPEASEDNFDGTWNLVWVSVGAVDNVSAWLKALKIIGMDVHTADGDMVDLQAREGKVILEGGVLTLDMSKGRLVRTGVSGTVFHFERCSAQHFEAVKERVCSTMS